MKGARLEGRQMLNRKEQKGMTLLGYVIVLGVVGFFALMLVKITPLYIEYRSVVSIINAVAAESSANESPATLRASIQKRLDVNDIERVKARDFRITQSRSGTTVGIEYEARTQFIGNMWLLMEFEHSAELKR